MTSVWYIGTSDERIITTQQWQGAGISGTPAESRWNAGNGWSLPASSFTAPQLAILDGDAGFITDAPDTPRPGPGFNDSPPADATQLYVDTAITVEQALRIAGDATNATAIVAERNRALVVEAIKADLVSGTVPDNQLPAQLARDSEVAAAIATEVAARNTAISTAISALVNSAPGLLDTLAEISAALANDPNFAATIMTAIGNAQTNAQTNSASYTDTKVAAEVVRANGAYDAAGAATAARIAAIAASQPLDDDLTTISAASNAAFGLGLLALADAAALRTAAGLGSAATQPASAFDASGAAATAQGAAQTYTDTKTASTRRLAMIYGVSL